MQQLQGLEQNEIGSGLQDILSATVSWSVWRKQD